MRKNSKKIRLESEINKLEDEITKFLDKKKQMSEKIDLSTLEDYESFKKIDNEGKSLFDSGLSRLGNKRCSF